MGNGTLDISGGTLKSTTLNAGAYNTAGSIVGSWTVNSGSSLTATGITNQANSATTNATSNNTVNQIVLRDGAGNFSAGTITANLTGNASTATNPSGGGSFITSLNIGSQTVAAIASQANSATITASTSATANQIVLRDGSGNATVTGMYVNSLNANNGGSAVVSGTWTLNGGASFQATYADLAEYYEGDQEYESGTVLIFGGEKEVTTTTQINDTRSAGVVTTNPAYTMNQEQTGIKVCIALAGRVPCKVVGRVKKGDMLTTSATPGYAVKALNPTLGSIIGKALEDKDSGEAGVIQVAIGRV
jgi:hypothetical protein